jgi:hypothetical protein
MERWEHAGNPWIFNSTLTIRMLDLYPLVMSNIAIENGPFIDGLPIKNGDFP